MLSRAGYISGATSGNSMSAHVFPLELENFLANFEGPEVLELDLAEIVEVRSKARDVSDESGLQVMTRQ